MTKPTRPEKKPYPFMSHHDENLNAAKIKGYNIAIDDCRAYYESDAYIQELINSGKIGLDEEKLASIFKPYYQTFNDHLQKYMLKNTAMSLQGMNDSLEDGLKAITQSDCLTIKEV